MADAETPFSNLSRTKLEILLRLSETAFPIWKRFEHAWDDEVPDHVAEATRAFALIHDAAKAWLETGALDAEELQAHVDAVEEGANEAGENSNTEIADQAVPAQLAATFVETLAWALGRLAGAEIIGQATPDPEGGGLEDQLDLLDTESEKAALRDLCRQLAAAA